MQATIDHSASQEIAGHIRQYLNQRGNKIQKIPIGVSGLDKNGKMKKAAASFEKYGKQGARSSKQSRLAGN